MRVVDAHQHFWDPRVNYHPWLCDEPMIPFRYGDYSAIRRPYLPDDYRRDAAPFDVIGSVYVETEWDPRDPIGEVRWVHTLAESEALPSAVVAQAWLDGPDAADVLGELADTSKWPLVRGVRHKPAAAPCAAQAHRGAPGSMDDPAWRRGFAELVDHGLSFDLQTPWWHLDAALDLATDFPAATIIVNHAGLPSDRSEAGLHGWREAMRALSGAPNVWVKISGLGQPGTPWTAQANRPIVLDIIELFGASRCMFASNFPVDSLCVSWRELFAGFADIAAVFTDIDRQALFAANALRAYRIDQAA